MNVVHTCLHNYTYMTYIIIIIIIYIYYACCVRMLYLLLLHQAPTHFTYFYLLLGLGVQFGYTTMYVHDICIIIKSSLINHAHFCGSQLLLLDDR